MELRRDYFLNRWVLLATERDNRPKQFKKEKHAEDKTDFFAPGNEHLTPPEIGRIPDGDSWKLRWFPNKFPAVEEKGTAQVQTHNDFFTFSDAYGAHEVIAETPDTVKQLWDLDHEQFFLLFSVYKMRINELLKNENFAYVSVFKNHGVDAGTSIAHSHSQIVAQNIVPPTVLEKSSHCKEYCPYCHILTIEKNSLRSCFENDRFVAFTPYASRFNLEIWVMPKEHKKSLDDMDDNDLRALADVMKRILERLKSLNAPFNYYLQYAPKDNDLHFHIEVIPRLNKWAGFEYASGCYINAITPENAAKFYRGETD